MNIYIYIGIRTVILIFLLCWAFIQELSNVLFWRRCVLKQNSWEVLYKGKKSMLRAYCLIYNRYPFCFTEEIFWFFNHWLKLQRKGVIFQGGCEHLSCHQSYISQVLWNSNEFYTFAVLESILLLSVVLLKVYLFYIFMGKRNAKLEFLYIIASTIKGWLA